MTSMNIGRRVYMCGAVLAALVVLVAPSESAAGDSPKVRVTQPVKGRVVLEVADETVAVRKEIAADRSMVTMTTAKDQLSMTIRRGVLTVTGPAGTVSLSGGAGLDADRLMAVLQRSDAATQARLLLERLSEGPNTFAGQSLLLTRAILEMGTGTGSGNALNRHQEWVAQRSAPLPGASSLRDRLRVIRTTYVSTDQMGPGDCWDLYAKEAIRIADDFSDCTDGLAWYEAHKWAGCSLIYAVRSEAAMAWFISCNGGVPFKG